MNCEDCKKFYVTPDNNKKGFCLEYLFYVDSGDCKGCVDFQEGEE